jgi:hypothetical protein
MKILSENLLTKGVLYFGITLRVPFGVKYLATDESGELYGYPVCPTVVEGLEMWEAPERSEYYPIGEVDLEGLDWRETLREAI